MPRKQYISDLAAAQAESPSQSVKDIQKGDDDGSFTFVYTPHANAKSIEVTVMIPELSEYPLAHECYLYTTSDGHSTAVTQAIENLQVQGKEVKSIIQRTAAALHSAISNKRQKTVTPEADSGYNTVGVQDEDEDEDENEDEAEDYHSDDDNVSVGGWSEASLEPPANHTLYGEGDSQMRDAARCKDPGLIQSFCEDLRALKDAGFRVGVWGGLPELRGYLSVSIRISKLGLGEEALNAWKLRPERYVVLLFFYQDGYKSLKTLSRSTYDGKKWVEISIGTCDCYKPSEQQCRGAFIKARNKNGDDGRVHVYGSADGEMDVQGWTNSEISSEGQFESIFISRPLSQLINERLLAIINYRVSHGFSWDNAEIYYDDNQGREKIDTVDEKYYYEEQQPVRITEYCRVDVLTTAGTLASFPLVAMQFMLRHLVRCTEFCLVCHNKVHNNFEALKPYVCSKPLCLYQYMALGFGPSMEYEILSQPSVVDLLISFCWTSASYNKLNEFPVGLNILVPPPPGRGHARSATFYRGNAELLLSINSDISDTTDTRLRVGDWITVKVDQANAIAQFRIIEADYWPRVKVGLPVYMSPLSSFFDKDHPARSDQVSVTVSINNFHFEDLNDEGKRASIVQLLNTLPSVNEMKEWLEKNTNTGEEASLLNWRNRMSLSACNLLRWIIASNRSCIVQIDETPTDFDDMNTILVDPVPVEAPIKKLHSGEERVYGMKNWLQFRFAMGAPDKEQRFVTETAKHTKNKPWPTLFAWHGSALENWHSIIREGLHFRETVNGRAYGNGCYHSLNAHTSLGYCHSKSTSNSHHLVSYWWRSHLRISQAMSLNEIINSPGDFVSKSPHLVVSQLDWIQTRYLFVQIAPRANIIAHKSDEEKPLNPLKQDPTMTATAINNQPLIIPKKNSIKVQKLPRVRSASVSSSATTVSVVQSPTKKTKGSRFGLFKSKSSGSSTSKETSGTQANPILISYEDEEDLGYVSAESEVADVEILFLDSILTQPTKEESSSPLPVVVTKVPKKDAFIPGATDLSDIILLSPPAYATTMATKRIQQELKALWKIQDTHEPEAIGWFINKDLVENVYQWIIELHSFDDDLPLSQDMRKNNIKSIVMEARFGKDFPMTPPFVRVIRPRFRSFMHGGGGHVTAGGALCMELLTNSGWSAVSSLESVLLQIRMALMSTDPFPARLVAGSGAIQSYSTGEAKEAFIRACRAHGWQVPPDFNSML